MKNKTFPLAPVLLALALILSACASPTPNAQAVPPAIPSNTPAPVGTATPLPVPATVPPATATAPAAPTATAAPSPTENPLHAMGQEIKVNGLTIDLIGVTYTATQLQATFAAKNTSAAPMDVAFIEFSAVPPDGTKLQNDACFTAVSKAPNDYAVPSFSGELLPGENLRGTVCWKGPALGSGVNSAGPIAGIQVVYVPEATNKPAAAWDVTSAANVDAPADLAASDFASPPHAQGEVVALKDITASFDKLTFVGFGANKYRVVMTHFTIANKGSTIYQFGEFLSYSFSLKLADGSPLGTDFMTAGCQNTISKQVILPGKQASYTLCFVSASTAPLAAGTLARFTPNPDQGGPVIWATQ